MNIGLYGILPAEVRYDNRLSDKAKLLYVEITALVNHEGECKENLAHLANVINRDRRTVYGAVRQLEEAGHILRVDGKIRIPSLSRDPQQKGPVIEYSPDIKTFFDNFMAIYEHGTNLTLKKKELYYPIIYQRLSTYSKAELSEALQNRIELLNSSEWHKEHIDTAGDLMLLIRDDTTIHQALNRKVKDVNEGINLKPLKFN